MIKVALSKEEEQTYIEKVKRDATCLTWIRELQTEAICLEAVKQDGYSLMWVEKQTDKICLEAVKQSGCALRWVINQTEELCWEAIRENGYALNHVKTQTPKFCLEAVKENGQVVLYIENPTQEMCLSALFNVDYYYVEYVFDHLKLMTVEIEKLKDILEKRQSKTYREIRCQLIDKKIDLNDSPYHVLERLHSC